MRRSFVRKFFRGFSGFNANDTMDQNRLHQEELQAEAQQRDTDELLSSAEFSLESKTSCPRSVLFVPCSNVKALNKVPKLNADAFILDLEDSVAPSKKDEARDNLVQILQSGVLDGKRLVVRVNSPRENARHGFVDLDAVGAIWEKVEGIAIPKTTKHDYQIIENSVHPDHCLWAFFETPEGVLDSYNILREGHYQFACMGLNDFCAEMSIPLSLTSGSKMSNGASAVPRRWPLHTAMSTVAMAARATGVHPLDGVYNDPSDKAGLIGELQEGMLLGFSGKTLIHPGQIDPTNEAFTPSEKEVQWAEKVINAVREAHGGVAVVEGKMVEDLHAKQAVKILQRAQSEEEGLLEDGAAPAGDDAAAAVREEQELRQADAEQDLSQTAAMGSEEDLRRQAARQAEARAARREQMIAGKRGRRSGKDDDDSEGGSPNLKGYF